MNNEDLSVKLGISKKYSCLYI